MARNLDGTFKKGTLSSPKPFIKGQVAWNKGIKFPEFSGENSHSWKGGLPHCLDCGEELSHYHCKRCKRCAAVFRKAKPPVMVKENHPNWKGGCSRYGYPFNFNNELKDLIRKRDEYKCQLCGIPQEECLRALSVHHKDSNKNNLNPENLITLCRKCHGKIHLNREYANYFTRNN